MQRPPSAMGLEGSLRAGDQESTTRKMMHSTANEAVDVAWAGCLPRSATPGFLTGFFDWLSWEPVASGACGRFLVWVTATDGWQSRGHGASPGRPPGEFSHEQQSHSRTRTLQAKDNQTAKPPPLLFSGKYPRCSSSHLGTVGNVGNVGNVSPCAAPAANLAVARCKRTAALDSQ